MSWKAPFDEGVTLFKTGKYPEALQRLNQAIINSGECHFILYDTRAAVFEIMDNPKDALKDARTTIKLAPQRWQGYARAARLFQKTHKFDASLKMIGLALSYIKLGDTKRREELLKLQVEITDYQEVVAARERRMQNRMLLLPVEIYNEIFECILEEDNAQIITLLHVCTYWRQVVWGSPGLWRTLVLSKSHTDKKADLWLERSRGRIQELHVLADYDSKCLPCRPKFLEKLNWSYLRVCRILSSRIMKFLNPSLMFQELITLELDSHDVVFPIFRNLNDFSSTKMKSLSFHGIHFNLDHLLRPFPLVNSLSLQKCVVSLTDLTGFFLANPQIESFHSRSNWVQGPMPPTSRSDLNNIPKLEKLITLEAVADPWTSTVLLFDVPSLQILRLSSLTNRHLSACLRHWASTSPKFLTEFSLEGMAVSSSIVLEVLRASLALEVLTLNAIYDTADTIVRVLSGQSPFASSSSEGPLPTLCPRLRHLDVSGCPDVATSSVHALVQQRLELSKVTDEGESTTREKLMVSRLEVLKMDRCPKIDVQWIPWFRQHVPFVTCVFASAPKKQQKGNAQRINGFLWHL